MIISVIKSSYTVRSQRCAEILCDPRLKTTAFTKLVKDFTALAEKLIELCNKEIPKDVHKTSVNSLLRVLPRYIFKFMTLMWNLLTESYRDLLERYTMRFRYKTIFYCLSLSFDHFQYILGF